MRIHIFGTPGSGKTTLARQLSTKLIIPHIEIDTLYWQSNWTHLSKPSLYKQIKKIVDQPNWIADGDYQELITFIWSKADIVIWLDYPISLALSRLLKRGIRAAITKQNLWNSGNHETLTQLFGPTTFIRRTHRSYAHKHNFYTKAIRQATFAKTRFYRFTSPMGVHQWLNQL